MKNKGVIFIVLALIIIVVVAFLLGDMNGYTEAGKFKAEYEEPNGSINEKSNKKYRELDIPKDNPMVYITAEEIIEKINNKETFAIYFGYNICPWCRSILPTLFEVADDLNIETIYYLDISVMRNTLELDNNGDVYESKVGSDGYYELLEKLDNVLADYTLTDSEGNEVKTGKKRIYAPNIVSIVNGEAQELTTGVSDKQDDAYMEITEEMEKEMYNKIKCVLECLNQEEAVCENKAC